MKLYVWGAIIFLFLMSACSQDSIFEGIAQDSSHDIKIDKAKTDLNNSNYDQVISSLSSLYTTKALNPEIGRILASAYMGKASIDTTVFVINATSSGVKPFDIAASMLSSYKVTVDDSNRRFIAGSLMDDILTSITNAKATLHILEIKGVATNDDIIQLGLASVAHLILYAGYQSSVAMNTTLHDYDLTNDSEDAVSAPINTLAYKYYSTSTDAQAGNISAGIFTDKTDDGSMYLFQEDLLNINNAIISFSLEYPGPNYIKTNLNNFLFSILGPKPDKTDTDDLILAYTTSGFSTFISSLAQ